MNHYQQLHQQILADGEYEKNIDWGAPRAGHPEGTVRAHIQELEENLGKLGLPESEPDYWKLKLLIHTHDSFKAEAKKGVAIEHPQSHASLARAFLQKFCSDTDLLNMVQYHDEPYALFKQDRLKGRVNPDRLSRLLDTIKDWGLFCTFLLVDNCTEGKSRAPVDWALEHLAKPKGKAEKMKRSRALIET